MNAEALAATSDKDTSRTGVEGALTALVGAFGTIVPPLTEADILAANLSIRAAATPIGAMPAVIDAFADGHFEAPRKVTGRAPPFDHFAHAPAYARDVSSAATTHRINA